jgi:transcriptional regulator NrdR family protein
MVKSLIVKRQGKEQKFDERKVYATCYAACFSASVKKQDAEKICEKVTHEIKKLNKMRDIVNSNTIFRQMVRAIKKHNKDAAFMYETHRDIS